MYLILKYAMIFKNRIYFQVLAVLCVLSLNLQCKKKYSDDNYFGGKVMILGHRGMGVAYSKPGNTYESIAPVIGVGADGTEIDIQLTNDSVLVLFHDMTMDLRSNCTGKIYDKSWSEIKQCRYLSYPQYSIFVNSVDELFSRIPNLNQLYFSFDCKLDNDVADKDAYRIKFLRAIKKLCDKYNMSNNVFIEGELDFLLKAQKLGLTNKLFLFDELTENTINNAYNNNIFGVTTSVDKLYNNVDLAHQKGIYIMIWSPDNFYQNTQALDSKADIIQTDNPISLLKILERYNYEYTLPE